MLTVKEAAKPLGVSPSLVYALIAARKIEHVRIGLKRGVIRIPEASIEEFHRSLCRQGYRTAPRLARRGQAEIEAPQLVTRIAAFRRKSGS